MSSQSESSPSCPQLPLEVHWSRARLLATAASYLDAVASQADVSGSLVTHATSVYASRWRPLIKSQQLRPDTVMVSGGVRGGRHFESRSAHPGSACLAACRTAS
jgi:hypothetical protein